MFTILLLYGAAVTRGRRSWRMSVAPRRTDAADPAG
jgi:hypothetical protein